MKWSVAILLLAPVGGCSLVLGANEDFHLVGSGGAGGGGAGGGGTGGGGGPACAKMCCAPTDCPLPSSPCKTATCDNGTCGETSIAADTPIPDALQTKGDCLVSFCDGLGAQASKADDADLPESPNPCRINGCSAGMLTTMNTSAGTPCMLGGGGAGACCKAVCVASVVDVAPGSQHTCARMGDGTLWCWGSNSTGQLGIGSTTSEPLPTQVTALGTTVATIAAGYTHTCASQADGTLWCWGYNSNGQLGIGGTTTQTSPAQVTTLGTGVVEVSANQDHTCARKADGTLWCWGDNAGGDLGIGSTTVQLSPVQVTALGADVASVSAGAAHTCARKADNTVWCWGFNSTGQLGVGTTANQSSPVQVSALGTSVVQVSAGGVHTCARKADNTLWCWGANSTGELGIGTTTDQTSPVQVTALGAEVAEVSAGNQYTCARKVDGTLWCWGWNKFSELGIGNFTDQPSPTQLGALGGGVVQVAAGNVRTCARKVDGTLWCWGGPQAPAPPDQTLPAQEPFGLCP